MAQQPTFASEGGDAADQLYQKARDAVNEMSIAMGPPCQVNRFREAFRNYEAAAREAQQLVRRARSVGNFSSVDLGKARILSNGFDEALPQWRARLVACLAEPPPPPPPPPIPPDDTPDEPDPGPPVLSEGPRWTTPPPGQTEQSLFDDVEAAERRLAADTRKCTIDVAAYDKLAADIQNWLNWALATGHAFGDKLTNSIGRSLDLAARARAAALACPQSKQEFQETGVQPPTLPPSPPADPPGHGSVPQTLPNYAQVILDIHNAERALVGAAPLAWDFAIAEREDNWAEHLADIGRLEHQPREGRGAIRENLAQIPADWDISMGIQLWIDERSDFKPGVFPNVSLSNDPNNVLHLTQMLWPDTLMIGCGDAEGGGFIYIACGYNPGGNRPGEWVGAIPVSNVSFGQGRSQLDEAGYMALDEAIGSYKANGRVIIEFHGTALDAANSTISTDRVTIIHEYLTGHGVPVEAINSGMVKINDAGPNVALPGDPFEPSELPAEPPTPAIVYFDWDRSELTPQAAAQLDRVAEEYRLTGRASVVLAGHADRSGNATYDATLAQQRANAARDYLTAQGVPAGSITTEAFGDSGQGASSGVQITFGPGSGW